MHRCAILADESTTIKKQRNTLPYTADRRKSDNHFRKQRSMAVGGEIRNASPISLFHTMFMSLGAFLSTPDTSYSHSVVFSTISVKSTSSNQLITASELISEIRNRRRWPFWNVAKFQDGKIPLYFYHYSWRNPLFQPMNAVVRYNKVYCILKTRLG